MSNFNFDPIEWENIKMLEQGEAMMGGPSAPINIALQRIINRYESITNNAKSIKLRKLNDTSVLLRNSYSFINPVDKNSILTINRNSNNNAKYLAKYDDITKTWAILSLFIVNSYYQYAWLSENNIIITGGNSNNNIYSKSIYKYDIINNSWSVENNVNDLFFNRQYNGIITTDYNKDIYVFGANSRSSSERGRISFKIDKNTGYGIRISDLPIYNRHYTYLLETFYIDDNTIIIPIMNDVTNVKIYLYDIKQDIYTLITKYYIRPRRGLSLYKTISGYRAIDKYSSIVYSITDDFKYINSIDSLINRLNLRDRNITPLRNDIFHIGTLYNTVDTYFLNM